MVYFPKERRLASFSIGTNEPAQNLSSDFVEWKCAVVITTTPRHLKLAALLKGITSKQKGGFPSV